MSPSRLSEIRLEYAGAEMTKAARIFESGALRVRHPRGRACLGVLINTGGGMVDGDLFRVEVGLQAGAAATLTTAAAEKAYRSAGTGSAVETSLRLAAKSRLAWVPQETILFDRSALRRRFAIDTSGTATFFIAEIVVFGRTAYGETDICGSLRDSWRLRRDGRLVFADETTIEGSIGKILDRGAVAGGCRAMATLMIGETDPAGMLDGLRGRIADRTKALSEGGVDGGATLRDGIVLARLLAKSGQPLRELVIDVLGALSAGPVPRIW